MSERVVRAARVGVRAGAWGGVCFGAISVLMVSSRAGLTLSETAGYLAIVPLSWFAVFFVLTFAFAYASPTTPIEIPSVRKLAWLLADLLFFAITALVWIALSPQEQ